MIYFLWLLVKARVGDFCLSLVILWAITLPRKRWVGLRTAPNISLVFIYYCCMTTYPRTWRLQTTAIQLCGMGEDLRQVSAGQFFWSFSYWQRSWGETELGDGLTWKVHPAPLPYLAPWWGGWESGHSWETIKQSTPRGIQSVTIPR